MLDIDKDLNFIPKKRNVLLHIKMRNIAKRSSDYKSKSLEILNYFKKNQKSILIPSFTYSFCKSKNINLENKKSEVGRFSEEIRKIQKKNRTLDPVFSFLNIDNRLKIKKKFSTNAFDNKSVFKLIHDKNFLIININLKEIVSTQFHKVEFDNKVPYRYNKIFKGKINGKKISYTYFVRNRKFSLKRKKILYQLMKKGVVKQRKIGSIYLRYFDSKNFSKFLNKKLSKNKFYLVS
tara:strand:- start:10 stop:714 length:705 start_codon:yes stop_codon:yes gene_type:complete